MYFTQDARVVGCPDIGIAKLGTLELQPGVDHPQWCGNEYVYNTYKDKTNTNRWLCIIFLRHKIPSSPAVMPMSKSVDGTDCFPLSQRAFKLWKQ